MYIQLFAAIPFGRMSRSTLFWSISVIMHGSSSDTAQLVDGATAATVVARTASAHLRAAHACRQSVHDLNPRIIVPHWDRSQCALASPTSRDQPTRKREKNLFSMCTTASETQVKLIDHDSGLPFSLFSSPNATATNCPQLRVRSRVVFWDPYVDKLTTGRERP